MAWVKEKQPSLNKCTTWIFHRIQSTYMWNLFILSVDANAMLFLLLVPHFCQYSKSMFMKTTIGIVARRVQADGIASGGSNVAVISGSHRRTAVKIRKLQLRVTASSLVWPVPVHWSQWFPGVRCKYLKIPAEVEEEEEGAQILANKDASHFSPKPARLTKIPCISLFGFCISIQICVYCED